MDGNTIKVTADVGGILPTWAWQLLVGTLLGVIGWGIKSIVTALGKLRADMSILTSTIATTATEMHIRNEMADERYQGLIARTSRLESEAERIERIASGGTVSRSLYRGK